jgi:hypothetical protein
MRHGIITASGINGYRGYFFENQPANIVGKVELTASCLYLVEKHGKITGEYHSNVDVYINELRRKKVAWESYTGKHLQEYEEYERRYLWLRKDEIQLLPLNNKEAKFLLEKVED